MRPEARLDRMLDALPKALQSGPRIAGVLATVAAELSGGGLSLERAVSLLMRSRWPTLARGWPAPTTSLQDKKASELGRLATLFDLVPLAGEASERFRGRLRAHVLLHRRGLTTAHALLEQAAAVYLPVEGPTITWAGDIARATLTIRDVADQPRTIRLELVDNPIRRCTRDVTLTHAAGPEPAPPTTSGQRPDETTVDNGGLDPAKPALTLIAETPMSVPELLHVESDLRLLYLGHLDAGDRLEIEADRPPTLNGARAPAPIILADPATFDEPSSFFAYQTAENGELVLHGARFSRADRWSIHDSSFFSLPCGLSRLRWRTVARDELSRLIAHWPDRDAVLDRAFAGVVPPQAARIGLTVRWREAQAATFSLQAPADAIPWHHRERPGLHWDALARVVERGRAAGIRGIIDLRPPLLRETIDVEDALSARARLRLGDSLRIEDSATVAGSASLRSGVFDESAYDQAFAETDPTSKRAPEGS